jgi:ribosomal protein L37E
MALIKCEECGKEYSDTAIACPHCGFRNGREAAEILNKLKAFNKKIWTCLLVLAVILAVVFVAAKIGKKAAPVEPEHYLGDSFRAGSIAYCVWDISWQNTIFYTRANSNFLIVNISIRNDGNKPKTIMMGFKLIDQAGREYEVSSLSMFLEGGEMALLETLNPGVQSNGRIAFDVPKENTYKLIVTGEFTSGKKATVNLTKAPKSNV